MSSSIAITVLSQSTLDGFCSTNKVSPISVVKLAFATVLHQYFDLPEFTCAEASPKDQDDPLDHDGHTRYPITRSQQVQYVPELASTVSIRAAFRLRETDRSSDDDLAPLLVNHTTTATPNGGLVVNRPTASLLFAKEASFSSLAARHVSGLGMSSYSHTFR